MKKKYVSEQGDKMNNTKYNGWTNRETWLVSHSFEINTHSDLEQAKETLETAIDECPPFLRDFIYDCSINWKELESHIEEEEEEEESEEESEEEDMQFFQNFLYIGIILTTFIIQ